MNPHGCACGFHTRPRKGCTCSPTTVSRYQKHISGPLLDRIDVFVEVPPVDYEKLADEDSSGARHRLSSFRLGQDGDEAYLLGHFTE